ncbi:MAG: hypothetical protein MUF31_14820, partial [Akkermansiaceae bacterium]|nr:hypothetical protein [Akkermansiaceae bacterium]
MMKSSRLTPTFLILALAALNPEVTQATIGVTNLGNTVPTGFHTGNTVLDPHTSLAGLPEVFGFRSGNIHNQTFTVSGYGIELKKILIGYGTLTGAATAATITLTVDAGNNGSNEISEQFTLTPASITQQAAAPYAGIHWLELDVTSSALVLSPGVHAFRLTVNSITGASNTWLLAPSYSADVNQYTGGIMSGAGNPLSAAIRDANFAIFGTFPDSDSDNLPDPWELSIPGVVSLDDL